MMHLVNVLVEKFCVQEAVNVIEEDVVNYVVGDNLINKLRETRNSPTIVWYIIGRAMLHDEKHRPEEDRPNDVEIKQKNESNLK